MLAEKEGRSVEVSHAESFWDGEKGTVAHEDEYGLLWVRLPETMLDNGKPNLMPFLPQELRFVSRNGGRQ